jgi:tight adherence protein C
MNSLLQPQVIVGFLASLCALGGVFCFALWCIENIGRLKFQGATIEQELLYDRATDFTKLPKLLGGISSKRLFRMTLSSLGIVLLPLIKSWQQRNFFQFRAVLKRLDVQLQSAGMRQYLPAEFLVIFVIFTTVAGGLLMALLALLMGFNILLLVFAFIIGGSAGLFAGRSTFSQAVSERKALIEKRLPFAVEFMLLAMESGLSFRSAMGVYCEQMKNDPLADEFRIVLLDIDHGLGIHASLINLEQRVQLEMLSTFITDIITGLETGQPIKAILEVQADAIRLKRHQEAEETAKKASTKAIFPMLLTVLAILLLLIGPLIISSSEMTLF